jgi:hypothetical protein
VPVLAHVNDAPGSIVYTGTVVDSRPGLLYDDVQVENIYPYDARAGCCTTSASTTSSGGRSRR